MELRWDGQINEISLIVYGLEGDIIKIMFRKFFF